MEMYIKGYDGQGRPVYADELTAEEIVKELKNSPEWASFSKRFDMSKSTNTTLFGMLIEEKLGPDPGIEDYKKLLHVVISAGGIVTLGGTTYEFELKERESEVVEEEVPRDHTGKPLTSSQLLWRQFAIWANDPNTTSEMIHQRRMNDRSFAEFYRRSLGREMTEGGVGDEVTNLNARPDEPTKTITPELRAWAADYHRTSSEKLRQLKRADTNPFGYVEWNRNFEAAVAAGLV